MENKYGLKEFAQNIYYLFTNQNPRLVYATPNQNFQKKSLLEETSENFYLLFAKHGGKLHKTKSEISYNGDSIRRKNERDKRPLIQRIMEKWNINKKQAQLIIRNHQ